MQYHTDIIPIRRNMLRDKVNLGTPGTSKIFGSAKLAITEFVENDICKDLPLSRKNTHCHNDTNRLPTGSEICLENIPSQW